MNISVEVILDILVIVYWCWNKIENWILGFLECKELGWYDMYVMVENVVSVVFSECYNEILGKIKILLIFIFYFILVVKELEFCVF